MEDFIVEVSSLKKIQLRAYRPRQLFYIQKQRKKTAKTTNKMYNKVIKIDDNSLN